MKAAAIIPARGGSKGIPRKNIISFCGAPLIAWSIDRAKRAQGISEVFVTTDCPEIAEVSKQYGASVIERPSSLASDTATSEAALLHAVDAIESQGRGIPEKVVFLQATSPLRDAAELDEALIRFDEQGFDSLFSGALLEDLLIWRESSDGLESWNYDFRNRKRRQDEEVRQIVETGSFYIFRPDLLRESGNRLGGKIGYFMLPFWKSFEIDSLESLELCQMIMEARGLAQKLPAQL